MKLSSLNMTNKANTALFQLALKVELFEQRRFPVTKDIDQVALLVQIAGESHHMEVKEKLAQLHAHLSIDDMTFLTMWRAPDRIH